MRMSEPPPHLYCIVATRAPVAVVFLREARKWWRLARWDLASGDVDLGAWFRGTLYPRRADLSPDGKLLSYFALKGVSTWSAVSRVPWLFALDSWEESGTWTRGCCFVDGAPPPEERVAWRRDRYVLVGNEPLQYGIERRRGWIEHESCPPRAVNDMWDEKREVILCRARPRRTGRLILTDHGWRSNVARRIEGRQPSFALELRGERIELADAAWTDWDADGRLLVATHDGRLQIRDVDAPLLPPIERDLAGDRSPSPAPAPAWAQSWDLPGPYEVRRRRSRK